MLTFLAILVIIKMAYVGVGGTEEGCEQENKNLAFAFIDCDEVQ